MAKLNSILGRISGKLDGHVFVKGKKNNFLRKNTAKGSKKDEPALKKQYTSAAYLNNLASELSTIIKSYCGNFGSTDLYHRILSRFLKNPGKLRILQLLKLKDLEINPRYSVSRLGYCNAAIKERKNNFFVTLEATSHPAKTEGKADCYYYEVLLLFWTKSKNANATHLCQLTDWIPINKEFPEFDFEFPKPVNTAHWLLCLGQQLGIDKIEIGDFPSQGMQIIAAGTFDKKEQEMLKTMHEENVARTRKTGTRQSPKEPIRVKAKRVKSK